ncbi:MAG: hypothetical protein HY685_05680 [Chloroflexi bacterium]|nr:hypothetical protein [Chloroflexota bacterium]
MRYRVIVLFSVLVLLLAACAPPPTPTPAPTPTPVPPKLLMTQGVFDDVAKIKTVAQALAAGYTPEATPGQQPGCVPSMGKHYGKGHYVVDGKRFPGLILMFDKNDQLLGFELESPTKQAAPPWEHLPQGHPGMAFEHWTLHSYLVDPTNAC